MSRRRALPVVTVLLCLMFFASTSHATPFGSTAPVSTTLGTTGQWIRGESVEYTISIPDKIPTVVDLVVDFAVTYSAAYYFTPFYHDLPRMLNLDSDGGGFMFPGPSGSASYGYAYLEFPTPYHDLDGLYYNLTVAGTMAEAWIDYYENGVMTEDPMTVGSPDSISLSSAHVTNDKVIIALFFWRISSSENAVRANVDQLVLRTNDVTGTVRSDYYIQDPTTTLHRVEVTSFDYGVTIDVDVPTDWAYQSCNPTATVNASVAGSVTITNTVPTTYELYFTSDSSLRLGTVEEVWSEDFEGDWQSRNARAWGSPESSYTTVFEGASSMYANDATWAGYSHYFSAAEQSAMHLNENVYLVFSVYRETVGSGNIYLHWGNNYRTIGADTPVGSWTTICEYLEEGITEFSVYTSNAALRFYLDNVHIYVPILAGADPLTGTASHITPYGLYPYRNSDFNLLTTNSTGHHLDNTSLTTSMTGLWSHSPPLATAGTYTSYLLEPNYTDDNAHLTITDGADGGWNVYGDLDVTDGTDGGWNSRIYFDGDGDELVSDASAPAINLTSTGGYTWSAWVHPTEWVARDPDWANLVVFAQGFDMGMGMRPRGDGLEVIMWLRATGDRHFALAYGNTYHLAAVYEGNGSPNRHLYINGTYVYTDTSGASLDVRSYTLRMGWMSGYTQVSPSYVWDCRFYDANSTQAHINTLFAGGDPHPANLVNHYAMREAEGTVVYDLGSAANNATLTGGVWDHISGYHFGGTASATQTGFRPLHRATAFTVAISFTPSMITTTSHLFSQRLDANNQVELYQLNAGIVGVMSNGASGWTFTLTSCLTAGVEHIVTLRWDTSVEDGKGRINVYNTATGVNTTVLSGTGLTSSISADADLYLGSRGGASSFYNYLIHSVAIYYHHLSSSELATVYASTLFADADIGWLLDEGSGDVFQESVRPVGYDFMGSAYATRTGFRPFHGLTAFTLSVWMTPHLTTTATDYAIIGSFVDGLNRVELLQYGTNIVTRVCTTTTVGNIPNADVLVTGSETHVVLTYSSGDNLRLYVDGTLYNIGTILTGAISANADLFIGARQGSSWFLASTLTQVSIFDYALSADDVGALHDLGHASYWGSPEHLWFMDEGSGDTFYDLNFYGAESYPITVQQLGLSSASLSPYSTDQYRLDITGVSYSDQRYNVSINGIWQTNLRTGDLVSINTSAGTHSFNVYAVSRAQGHTDGSTYFIYLDASYTGSYTVTAAGLMEARIYIDGGKYLDYRNFDVYTNYTGVWRIQHSDLFELSDISATVNITVQDKFGNTLNSTVHRYSRIVDIFVDVSNVKIQNSENYPVWVEWAIGATRVYSEWIPRGDAYEQWDLYPSFYNVTIHYASLGGDGRVSLNGSTVTYHLNISRGEDVMILVNGTMLDDVLTNLGSSNGTIIGLIVNLNGRVTTLQGSTDELTREVSSLRQAAGGIPLLDIHVFVGWLLAILFLAMFISQTASKQTWKRKAINRGKATRSPFSLIGVNRTCMH